MIGDPTLAIAKLYDMLPADEPGTSEGRTAATNQKLRSVFIVVPDKKVILQFLEGSHPIAGPWKIFI